MIKVTYYYSACVARTTAYFNDFKQLTTALFFDYIPKYKDDPSLDWYDNMRLDSNDSAIRGEMSSILDRIKNRNFFTSIIIKSKIKKLLRSLANYNLANVVEFPMGTASGMSLTETRQMIERLKHD